MTTTTNLALPYILAAQSQKHVTHNEALRTLDAVVQIAVADRDLAAPPSSPEEGQRFIVATGASGAWSGQAGRVAAFQDGAWAFYTPRPGWLAWIADEGVLVVWTGAAWVSAGGAGAAGPGVAAGGTANQVLRKTGTADYQTGWADLATLTQNLSGVGIGTTSDATNKLAVKSAAVLFDNVGNGVQFKVNKAAATDTASLLFQTGYSGRAEVGLAGNDALSVKVSSDGATWYSGVLAGTTSLSGGAPIVAFGRDTLHSSAIATLFQSRLGVLAGFVSTVPPVTNANGAGGAGMVGYVEQTPTAADQRLGYLLFGSRGGEGGESFAHAAGVQSLSTEAWTLGSAHGADLRFLTTANGTAVRTTRWVVDQGGGLRPFADNAYALGSASFRVSNLWAANGTIQTSDARDKEVTGRISGAMAAGAVDAIEPIQFRWKVGGYEMRPHPTETTVDETGAAHPVMVPVPVPGQRIHAGFLAQEVRAAMDAAGVDFGVWGLDDKTDPDSRQWLRPDQIIPVLWAALRQTRAELAALREQIGGRT